jgi:hypothetical protein
MTQCPACQAALPVPAERFCANCGYDLQAGRAPGLPPPPPPFNPRGGGWGAPPRPSRGTPWERRAQLGLATALVETTAGVLMRPVSFFREMPVSGLGSALGYGLIVGYLGAVATAIYDLVFSSVLGAQLAQMAQDPQLQPYLVFLQSGQGLGGFLIKLVLGLPILLLLLFLVSGILHVFLLLLSGAASGFEATFRVVAYAEGAAILNVLPICGGLFAGLYMPVLWVIGLKEAHQISYGKAVAAVLLPFLLCCCCCAFGVFLFFGSIASMLGTR